MPRPRRCVPANYVFHVLNRGCHGRRLFDTTADYGAFRALLAEGAERIGMRVCGFDVMPNHWHLVVWPEKDGAVSAFVHWLCTAHVATRAHTKKREVGHLYQGRFRCFAVQEEVYYYNALKYVEANALRAGLVQRAEDWKWSSAWERIHGSELLVPGPLPLPPDWVSLVNRGFDPDDLRALRASVRSSRPYGSPLWAEQTSRSLGLEQKLHGVGRTRTRAHRAGAALVPHGAKPSTLLLPFSEPR
jgi:putative transposase